ncbi:unknown similar to AMEVITR03 [Choristoneura rosaceana entomopoxvirus 'L']|uniref:N1R/p28-like protein n=1 Tax=Choristoneura rosaceana entomopoxvirus 'L' TaxID=1293539 RepID=A0ABM9QL02_9POXV|nr:unknown similar to AMEVITR03 [Choristoneura rosaceana entomopoxvirus 'L']CCU56186.1 unknown similar to AMEVITR03 [Choristoneura rosaceana entomopoxvirus 'L']
MNEDILDEIYNKIDIYSLSEDANLINEINKTRNNVESPNYELIKSFDDCKCLIGISYYYLDKERLVELIKRLMFENTILNYVINKYNIKRYNISTI